MGKATVQMTLFASAILLAVGSLHLGLGLTMKKATPGVRRTLIVAGAIILLCLPASLLLKVRNYEITRTHLVVRIGLSERSFPLNQVASVNLQPNALSGGRRDFGNGGLWSFAGTFSNPQLGEIRSYVSDLQKTVIIKLPDFAIVVSPDDPTAFVRELQARKGALQG